MVNKFLYPNGGSETYIFKLGDYLKSQGHEVQYFGMEHKGRCAGNRVNAYTSDMDFHGGSKLSKAVQYALNEKRYLYGFLADPGIEISNNRAENAIRPFVIGRKNWLFSDTPKGAAASAVLYSLIISAKMNGQNVEEYLVKLLRSSVPVLPY